MSNRLATEFNEGGGTVWRRIEMISMRSSGDLLCILKEFYQRERYIDEIKCLRRPGLSALPDVSARRLYISSARPFSSITQHPQATSHLTARSSYFVSFQRTTYTKNTRNTVTGPSTQGTSRHVSPIEADDQLQSESWPRVSRIQPRRDLIYRIAGSRLTAIVNLSTS